MTNNAMIIKEKKERQHNRLHYATMFALMVSNFTTLGLAMTFANVMGGGMGEIYYQGELAQIQKASAASAFSKSNTILNKKPIPLPQPQGPSVRAVILPQPASGLVVGGSTREVGRFTLTTEAPNVVVESFIFTIEPPDQQYPTRLGIVGDGRNVTQIEVWPDIGSYPFGTVILNGDNQAEFTFPIPQPMNPGQAKTFVVKARFAEVGELTGVVPGSGIAVKLFEVTASDAFGRIPTTGLGQPFYTFSTFKSVPTFSIQSYQTTISTSTPVVDLMKFSVTANSVGPVGLAKLNFYIEGLYADRFANFLLYESDSPLALGSALAWHNDFAFASSTNGLSAIARFDVNNDDSTPHARPGITESFVIQAGATKYFTLRATPYPYAFGLYTSYILEDQGFAGTQPLNVLGVEQSSMPHTIWSDLSFDLYSTSTATQTSNWFNGYRVNGLPMGAP